KETQARELLEPLAKDPAGAAEATLRLAIMDRNAGRSSDGYKRIETVLSTDSKQLQALTLKSAFLFEDGKLDDALAAATAAVEAHPESFSAFSNVGRVQAARRQTDAAIAAYQAALRLNPYATGVKVALARLQLSKGRPESTVGLAEETLRGDP